MPPPRTAARPGWSAPSDAACHRRWQATFSYGIAAPHSLDCLISPVPAAREGGGRRPDAECSRAVEVFVTVISAYSRSQACVAFRHLARWLVARGGGSGWWRR